MGVLTPERYRGVELLDDPAHDSALAIRSLHDVAKANRLFGGRRAVLRELAPFLASSNGALSLLDIGTGLGDIPDAASHMARRRGASLTTLGLELDPSLARVAAPRCTHVLAADTLSLPFADRSIDVVSCSQVLHHFDGQAALTMLRECTRVARAAVIVADLRRNWLAVAGLWSSSFLLGFHPISRHDGMLSIRRGFTLFELQTLIERATGCRPRVRTALGWRITATWSPA